MLSILKYLKHLIFRNGGSTRKERYQSFPKLLATGPHSIMFPLFVRSEKNCKLNAKLFIRRRRHKSFVIIFHQFRLVICLGCYIDSILGSEAGKTSWGNGLTSLGRFVLYFPVPFAISC